jgi:DMSO/TMAO reductase YedYZ molybdopterin-dependent catalytic subunit
MKKWYAVLALALLLAVLVGCAGGSGAPKAEWTVKVSGAVSKPLQLSYADLSKRPQVKLENVIMRKSQGEDTTNTWEGPALDAILKDAGASAKATGLTFKAADGYAMQLTMQELNQAIIALKVDGKWITEDEKGPIRLVVPDKPANAWLSQLTDIEVIETAIIPPTPKPTKAPTPKS